MAWFGRAPGAEPRKGTPSNGADRAAEADVRLAYRLILKRDADEAGLAHYRERIRSGLLLQELIAELIESDEHRARLERAAAAPAPDAQAPATARSQPDATAAAGLIDPADVMRRYTVEELAETAEEYYRRIPDPTPLMSKPFSFLHETPEMLQNLGLLLSGLHLGKTMTVLDFGGGTGWVSRMLAQLNCQAICCDVSKTALEIGRRLFDEQPLIGTAVYRPRLLWFDGHRLDLGDASVDRIICFDAFHHVPNPGEVLAEFGRVLRPGGIAGFSEPGRHHSRSPQSQYEMTHHRVLENDIDLDAIFGLARPAGFTDLTVKVLTDMALPLEDYRRIAGAVEPGTLPSAVWRETVNTMTNRSIFFLHKGPLRRDSRGHAGLAHRLRVEPTDCVVAQGEPLRVSVSVTNTGDAWWLDTNTELFGIVRLGSHLYDADGTLVDMDFSRHALPAPVGPGETIDMAVDVPLPGSGPCRLAFDLVAEGVMWFENLGSTPVYVTVRRQG
jgi:SAM-dependent methyltransferase